MSSEKRTFSLKFEFNISESDSRILESIFTDKIASGEQLEEILSDVARASLSEYVELFVGRKVFRRGSDFNEFRLLQLIHEVLGKAIPSEELVSRMFQTSSTGSKSLINSTISKYQYSVREAIDNSLIKILEDVSFDGDSVTAVIYSDNLKGELNRILSANKKSGLKQIVKDKGTIANYSIPIDSYHELCAHFDIEPKELEDE